MQSEEPTHKQSFTLKPQEELRFEVDFGKTEVTLTLTQGKVSMSTWIC